MGSQVQNAATGFSISNHTMTPKEGLIQSHRGLKNNVKNVKLRLSIDQAKTPSIADRALFRRSRHIAKQN